MARTLLSGANIVYNGNPLKDLSLNDFLDKFLEKKPKQIWTNHLLGRISFSWMKWMQPQKILSFINHRFYMNKQNSSNKPKKKKKKGAEEEAAEDLLGEWEEDESDNKEIDVVLDSTNSALDSEAEYDYDNLDQVADEDDNHLVGDHISDEELSSGDSKDGSDDENDLFDVKLRNGKATFCKS